MECQNVSVIRAKVDTNLKVILLRSDLARFESSPSCLFPYTKFQPGAGRALDVSDNPPTALSGAKAQPGAGSFSESLHCQNLGAS